ncbi:HAND2 [Mytilus edulis]|uniref:HAND2 n=1 Tax=Mytilus edulis TaxID=6550 RepID=A0A8S3TP91_MYTED|nr:HAND2 [Mytilus edulis]
MGQRFGQFMTLETMGVCHYICLTAVSFHKSLSLSEVTMAENFALSPNQNLENDDSVPIDLTKDSNDNSSETDNVINRRKRKPKKFENLSDIDIEERRNTANVQERKRMKKLSKALEDLRKCIPAEYHLTNRKMSKIRTLKLAVNYIASLTDIIDRDNLLKQQAFHHESQLIQSTYSYLMPSPIVQQGNISTVQQSGFSPYHTPCISSEHNRLPKRHLNFSPFCGTPIPSMISQGRQLTYQTPVKSEPTPYRIPEMIERRRTSTFSSPSFIGDLRNMNEVNTSFLSPMTDDSDVGSGPSRLTDTKQYAYTLDGISPLPEEEKFRGTDCVFDPRRRIKKTE